MLQNLPKIWLHAPSVVCAQRPRIQSTHGRREVLSLPCKLAISGMALDGAPSFFTVMATGQIESADLPGYDNAYCKFEVVAGEDWQLLDGMENGITQVARPSPGPERALVWNFPVDFTYKATNAFGWPQLVVSVYGVDSLGRDVVQGYGAVHVPPCAGRYTLRVRLFKPRSASAIQRIASWLTGMQPEFSDPKFPSYGEGREVTRVVSNGHVSVQLNVLTKDMVSFGFAAGDAGGGRDQSSVAA